MGLCNVEVLRSRNFPSWAIRHLCVHRRPSCRRRLTPRRSKAPGRMLVPEAVCINLVTWKWCYLALKQACLVQQLINPISSYHMIFYLIYWVAFYWIDYIPGTQIGVKAFFWRVVSFQNRGHSQVPGTETSETELLACYGYLPPLPKKIRKI